MNIEKDDPRLTAYVLGELTPDEAKQFEHAIAADPALKMVVKEIERTQADLFKALGTEEEKLLPRQRAAIMRAAREATGANKVEQLSSYRKASFNVWTWPLAAAAVVIASLFIVTLFPAPKNGNPNGNVATGTNPLLPDEFVAVDHRGDAGKAIGLPLVAGSKSLPQITQSIRDQRGLPSKTDVRIEELLNAFPLDAKISVAVWQGCSVGIETIKCPWSPSGSLVFIKIRGAKDHASRVSLEYRIDQASVVSSRLLGYELEENSRERRAMPQNMAAGSEIFLALWVESKNQNLGKLVWSVDESPAPEISLLRDDERETSADSRFASLICGFGLWLRDEHPQMIDDTLLLGLARQVAGDTLVADRYDFLELIDHAVKVKNK